MNAQDKMTALHERATRAESAIASAKATCDSYADENQRLSDRVEALTAEVERLRAAAQSAIDGYAKGDDVFGPMQKLRAAVQQTTTPAAFVEAKKERDSGWPDWEACPDENPDTFQKR